MSYNVLSSKVHRRDLRDDMESLYYVVLYSGVRWLPHNEVENLGEETNIFFFDFSYSGTKPTRGAQKHLNIDLGTFTDLFVWTDEATTRWMHRAWMIQHYELRGARTWTPSCFIEVWTIALSLNPPKSNRCEHAIRIDSDGSTDQILPAPDTLNPYSASFTSYMKNIRDHTRVLKETMRLEEIRRESILID